MNFPNNKKVIITGGSGLVGQELTFKLQSSGYNVCWLTRKKVLCNIPNVSCFLWNYKKQHIENGALDNTHAIIHLAGANIGSKRWSRLRKEEILESRIETTKLLFNKIVENKVSLKVFISASAIGYYGTSTSTEVFEEDTNPGNDFLARVCVEWERAAAEFEKLNVRTVILRTAIVLSKDGGVLKTLLLPAKIGLNSPIGNGKQYMPWIHIKDLCNLYMQSIENEKYNGVYNAVGNGSTTNSEFCVQLSKILNSFIFVPNVPSIVFKIIFGEMSILLLEGSRISNQKILLNGFNVKFPILNDALVDLIKNSDQ